MTKVIVRVDANRKRVKVQDGDTVTEYGTVVLSDVEFGFGAMRGTLEDTSDAVVPTSRLKNRAYWNEKKVDRYVAKDTMKPIVKTQKFAYIYGSTVMFQ